MFKLLAATVGALMMSAPALGAEMDGHKLVAHFTLENVAGIAATAGYQTEVLSNPQGQQALGIKSKSGARFLAQNTACKTGTSNCAGLVIFAIFSDRVSPDVLGDFNAKHAFTSAFAINTQTVLSRYEIADFGIPAGNIATNLTNFEASMSLLAKFVTATGTGASFTPPAQTARPEAAAFGGAPIAPATAEDLYKPTPEQLDKVVNKIAK